MSPGPRGQSRDVATRAGEAGHDADTRPGSPTFEHDGHGLGPAFAAAVTAPPTYISRSILRLTSSAASSAALAYCPCAYRHSMPTFWPSTHPCSAGAAQRRLEALLLLALSSSRRRSGTPSPPAVPRPRAPRQERRDCRERRAGRASRVSLSARRASVATPTAGPLLDHLPPRAERDAPPASCDADSPSACLRS